jgi:tetratricopeptide (TPR) repeat protein
MTTQATNPSTTGSLQPGDKLDKYEVREVIGAGGMAVVHKGYDALLDRFVAIKQINTELAAENGDEGIVERFRREAKLQKRVAPQHKHLVSFIDFLENPRGLFIVQEFVDGVSLEQVLTTKPQAMDHRQALGIIGATTLALQAIHAKGIVHRDLKPSNILLPHDGGLKVCDFGLAATIAEQESLPLGSVRYMAPELFSGEKVDGRADIYALGMIAYEMLLGRAAFNEAFKIVLRDQRNQALRWMKWHTNMRVRATPLSQLNPDISDTLSDLVARMMDKDAQTRIQSADELLETIRRHFTPGASPDKRIVDDTREVARSAPAASKAEATAKLPTGSRLPYILVAVLVVNVLAGLGLWAWYAQDKASKREAVRNEVRQTLSEGQAAYRSGDFARAAAIYESVQQAWPADAEFGKASLTGALMSQAHLDIRAGRYLEGVAKLDKAEQEGEVRDRQRWADLKRQALEDYAFSNVIAEIQGHIDEGRFAQADWLLRNQERVEHPDHRRQKLQEINEQIRRNMNETEIALILDRVDQQLAANRSDKAVEILEEGAKKFPGSELERRLIRLRGEIEYRRLIAAGHAAAARGDLDVAIDTFTRAVQIIGDSHADTTGLRDQIKQLRIELAMQRAREAYAANDIPTASFNIETVLALDPNHREAIQLKSQIATADEKADMVRAGDQAMAQRQFDLAITHYSNALKFGPDATIADKRMNAELQLNLEKARIAISQENLGEADEALRKAESIAGGDPIVENLRSQLSAWVEFKRMLVEADASRAAGRYGEAIDRYRRVQRFLREKGMPQAVLDSVQDRIDGANYQSLFAQAQFEVESKRWVAADGILKVLANMPNGNTPEVQALMVEVQRNKPRGPTEP